MQNYLPRACCCYFMGNSAKRSTPRTYDCRSFPDKKSRKKAQTQHALQIPAYDTSPSPRGLRPRLRSRTPKRGPRQGSARGNGENRPRVLETAAQPPIHRPSATSNRKR